MKALHSKMTHFKGAEGRVKKGVSGKGKKQPPPPPPEIKALRETWSAVIEVRESSKPRKVLLNPARTRQYSFQPFDSLLQKLESR